jgi:hypothetical protein
LLDAGMAGVVPIAEGRLVGKVGEEVVETVVERQFEDPLAVFDPEDEVVRDDGGKKLVVGGEDAFERSPGSAAESCQGAFSGGGCGGWIRLENAGGIAEKKRGAARVHHDIAGSDAGGKVEGAPGVKEPESAFVFLAGGWLEEIRSRVSDHGGERTEIVDRGDRDDTFVDRAKDARGKFETDAVTEFGPLEAEGADLGEHFEAIGVTVGIPAGGKGKAAG